jgi:glycosyltransferase involved in cell wall biosynthesis
MTDISVIIPSNHSHHELLKVVSAICQQTLKPAEIVIVDSSLECGACPKEVTNSCAFSGIQLIYVHLAHALPGRARNIGLELSSAELIAFIDVQTIPKPNWLEISSHLLTSNRALGVWGATNFNADTTFERLVRDSFHGVQTLRTLPGSVFDRKVFAKVGQFIDWARAGEDTEWMLRAELLKVPVVCPTCVLIDYVGLIGLDFKTLLRKWHRNYSAARGLPQFYPHRLILWLIFYPLLILIAFNWNYLVADWRLESPFYIGHVTKIVAILPSLTYVVIRGMMLPLKRGIAIKQLLPTRFLAVTFVCFIADAVKVLMFSIPKRKHDFSAIDHES